MWYTMQAVCERIRQEMTKTSKSFKTPLTKLVGYGIISNTSALWEWLKKVFKKTFSKPLDKGEWLWYNTKAVRTKVSAAKIDH